MASSGINLTFLQHYYRQFSTICLKFNLSKVGRTAFQAQYQHR